jgi:hypothetical protein
MGTVPSSTAGSLPFIPAQEALPLPTRKAGKLWRKRIEAPDSRPATPSPRRLPFDPFPPTAEIRSKPRQLREGPLDRKLIIV